MDFSVVIIIVVDFFLLLYFHTSWKTVLLFGNKYPYHLHIIRYVVRVPCSFFSFLLFFFLCVCLIFVNFIHYMMASSVVVAAGISCKLIVFPPKPRTHAHTFASTMKRKKKCDTFHNNSGRFFPTIIKTENESLLELTPT